MSTQLQLPLPELAGYLARLDSRCQEKGWFGARFHVGVLRDIVADLTGWLRGLGRAAHAAECDDAEAEKLITAMLADGRGGRIELWTLIKPLGRHPARSTLARSTLNRLLGL